MTIFPRNVQEKLAKVGYLKSKKGNFYKVYKDSEEEILAIPNCRRDDEGMRRIDWYLKFSNQDRRLIYQEAAELSPEFNRDSSTIHKLIKLYEY